MTSNKKRPSGRRSTGVLKWRVAGEEVSAAPIAGVGRGRMIPAIFLNSYQASKVLVTNCLLGNALDLAAVNTEVSKFAAAEARELVVGLAELAPILIGSNEVHSHFRMSFKFGLISIEPAPDFSVAVLVDADIGSCCAIEQCVKAHASDACSAEQH